MTGSTHPDVRPIAEIRAPSEVTPELVRLAVILEAVGREVARLGQAASDLQEVLSPLARAFGKGGRNVEDIQALDLISQHLYGVANFLGALAPTLPIAWAGDAVAAARAVTLSSLAQRLSCPPCDFHPAEGEVVGELELFEAGGE